MTNPVPVPVSQFPAAGALIGTEIVGVVKNGVTSQTTTQDIAALSSGAVNSVNGQTGVVVLTAADVGALASNAVIPTVQGGTNLTAYAQGDLIYASATDVLARLPKDTGATRYLSNTGASNAPAWAQVNLANGVTGTLPIENGGTGQATANAALNALLPDQTGHSGEVLTTNGTDSSWVAGGGVSAPADEIVYGTGAAVTSSSLYLYATGTNEGKHYGTEVPLALARRAILSALTIDDEPTLLFINPDTTSLLFINQAGDTGSVWGLRIVVSAINAVSGADAATFHIEGTVFFNVNTFDVEILGSTTKVIRATAGAAAWDADLIVSGAFLAIQVTGEVDVTIQWGALVDGMHIGASVA